jgi:short-subunit dehydrogenase
VAATRLARAVLPRMTSRGRGAIINVASMLAFSLWEPLPHRVIYAATKAYLLAFSQALADEVRSSGVDVQALCPGVVATEFHLAQGGSVPPGALEASDVVDASFAALTLGETVCTPTVEDATALAAVRDAHRALFAAQERGVLASRYRRGLS